jgi:hypothetical protein
MQTLRGEKAEAVKKDRASKGLWFVHWHSDSDKQALDYQDERNQIKKTRASLVWSITYNIGGGMDWRERGKVS